MIKDSKRDIPISSDEFYLIQHHHHARFDYVLHYHNDFELNLVLNTSGKRIINASVEQYNDIDLVLAGPYVLHSWKDKTKRYEASNAQVVTLQFHKDFLDQCTLNRKPLTNIKKLLKDSYRGVLFSKDTAEKIKNRLINLHSMNGFTAFTEFLSILNDLSLAPGRRLLSSAAVNFEKNRHGHDRLGKLFKYIEQHFDTDISASKAASIICMTPSAFSHYFKKHTSMTFVDYLNDYRLGKVINMLTENDLSVSEIAGRNGFFNLQSFYRIFKKKIGCIPMKYRELSQSHPELYL